MQPSVLLLLSCAWLTASRATSEHEVPPCQPKVTLPGGSVVSGIIDGNYSSVRQFLGVPYAQPPLGELRWEAPRANRLPRTVNATEYGLACTQFLPSAPNAYQEVQPQFNNRDLNSSGEDCLTLSVWTPERARKLPVMVYLYGGGWYTGGQDTPYLIPTQWVQRTKDLIVVTPNYRGNIFGFPNARGVKDQNLGLLDQRLAIEWVRDNIKAFGGDPRKITIWGPSSGGISVDMYNYAWYKDPIVKGLIMHSGTSFIEDGISTRYSNFSYVAGQVGCGDTSSAEEELACMKTIDAVTLETVIADHLNAGATPGLAFGPSADEKVVFFNYTERALQGKLMKVPAIIGLTKEDGAAFAPYNASGPDPTIAEYWFLTLFLCTSYKTSKLRSNAAIPTYRYLYSGNFSNISPEPWMGAYHGAEMPMLFGTHGNFRGPSTQYEIAVSEEMQDTWRAFAEDPWRGLGKRGWMSYTDNRDVVRVFGEEGGVVRDGVGELNRSEGMC
ncbi:acetylcholinesterase [Patellaria atrata CBS 101060]|uniref:Carboxylic ester hydrolase n=1 Tax=Patellaria atrata CBS 101060 TaxID=1346257 RepID=A0A9P4VU84_9PEZI|nr:acetylcholinesterase [Patellaria atrata CBS 101060]